MSVPPTSSTAASKVCSAWARPYGPSRRRRRARAPEGALRQASRRRRVQPSCGWIQKTRFCGGEVVEEAEEAEAEAEEEARLVVAVGSLVGSAPAVASLAFSVGWGEGCDGVVV